jgi:hypothetical protein
VVGTGVSTFVAHVLAESVGFRVRTDQPTGEHLRHELCDSVPIVSATSPSGAADGRGPAGMAGRWPGIAARDLRDRLAAGLTRLGGGACAAATCLSAHFLSGVLLALAGVGAAALNWWLTH